MNLDRLCRQRRAEDSRQQQCMPPPTARNPGPHHASRTRLRYHSSESCAESSEELKTHGTQANQPGDRPFPCRRSARRPMAIGHDLAAEVIRFRNGALRGRAAAVQRRAPRRPIVRSVPPALVRAAGGRERTGVLVAEGDSWFDYPWHDVLRMLEDVTATTSSRSRIAAIRSSPWPTRVSSRNSRAVIEKLLRQNSVPDAILLSGGGNDIAGDQFQMLHRSRACCACGAERSGRRRRDRRARLRRLRHDSFRVSPRCAGSARGRSCRS